MNDYRIAFIDPGTTQSAFVVLQGKRIIAKNLWKNEAILEDIAIFRFDLLGIEQFKSYGMPIGDSTIHAIRWSGKFELQWNIRTGEDVIYIPRKTIVTHICGSPRAKDTNIRHAMLDEIGPQGTKKAPGPTYGMKKDLWQALGGAVYLREKIVSGELEV